MFPFFKKKKDSEENLKRRGSDSTIDAKDMLGDDGLDEENEELVDTELSLHPDWKVPPEKRYVFAFMNQECPPLKPNQLSLAGIEMAKRNDEYIFTAFIRHSLSKTIRLRETAILLIGPDNEKLGRKVFNLKEAGKIPAKSARPWQFVFQESDLFTKEIPEEGWKLAFELRPSTRKNVLDLAESWKQSLADDQVKQLEQIVENAKPLKPGEINFMNIQAQLNHKGDLAVTLLIRNGSPKSIYLDQVPLQVEDASGEVIARANFNLNKLEVKANTSKPWTFIFPQKMLAKDKPDLSKWKAYPITRKTT